MKFIVLYSMVLSFVIGAYVGYTFKKDRVVEKRVVEYQTEYRYKPVKVTPDMAIKYLTSPLTINHYIKNNWMYITASDDYKLKRKNIKLGWVPDWRNYLLYGLAGAVIASSFYWYTTHKQINISLPLTY